jgi:hypothetical protein
MSELITLGLYALATARLVRLVMEDRITGGIRAWIIRRATNHSTKRMMVAYLISCGWCTSIWVAAPCAAAYVLVPHHPAALIPAALLTFSWLAVMAADLQRLVNGKATLYNQPMPLHDDQEAHR